MKTFLLALSLASSVAFANPNGYVLLAPDQMQQAGKNVRFLFTLPCDSEDAKEQAQFISNYDGSGDMTVTVGLLYPAGYCMDSLDDVAHARPTPYVVTKRAASLGLDHPDATMEGATLLPTVQLPPRNPPAVKHAAPKHR